MVHFKHWLGVGVLFVAAGVFAWLGRWQLERAATHRAIEVAYRTAAELPLLERPVAEDGLDEFRYRQIQLSGVYEAGVQILLDNMTYQGLAGYEVLTPLRLASGLLVLVNRGWLPTGPDRNRLPDVALADQPAVVTGRVDRLPRAAFALASEPAPAGTPVVRLSYPDHADIQALLGNEVQPFQLLLDSGETYGFQRDWSPDFDRDERSIAYAVQWFALSGLALVLAFGAIVRARRRGYAP